MHGAVTKPWSLLWKVQNSVLSVCPRVSRFQEASHINRLMVNQRLVLLSRTDVAIGRTRVGTEVASHSAGHQFRVQTSQQGQLEILRAAQAGRAWRNVLLNTRMSLCSSAKQGKSWPLTDSAVVCMSSMSSGDTVPDTVLSSRPPPAPYLLDQLSRFRAASPGLRWVNTDKFFSFQVPPLSVTKAPTPHTR